MASNNNDSSNIAQVRTLNGKTYKNVQIVSGMNQQSDLKPLGLRNRAVYRQVLMVFLANLSVLNTGVVLGYATVVLSQLQDENEAITLTDSQLSWFTSIVPLACPFAGILSGYLMDRIGRKRSLLFTNMIALVGWIIIATTFSDDKNTAFVQLMIGRFFTGLASGMGTSPAGVYSAEVSHTGIRGRCTVGVSIAVASGITIIYILGYFIRDDWRLLSVIAGVFTMIAFFSTAQIPESPNFLLAKGRTEEARKSLKFLRGLLTSDQFYYEEFEIEFSNLKRTATVGSEVQKEKFGQVIKRPEIYKPLLIMITFFAFQQFSGIFVVIFYAVQFSKEAGVQIDDFLCSIYIGVTRLVTTLAVTSILDKWGRRPPALASAVGMSICMLLLASSTWFPKVGEVPYLSVICLILYILFSTIGLMTLPFTMISEVFPQKVRGISSGLCVSFGYGFGFIIIKSYQSMVTGMGKENVFAFYGVVSLLAIVFVYVFLPEPKGKTLVEIEDYFKYGKKGKPYSEEEMKEIYKPIPNINL